MDWLKDKKNQPIIAAIAAVVIVGVAAAMWFFVIRKPSEPESTAADAGQPAPVVGPGAPSGMPGGVPAGAPGATPGATTATSSTGTAAAQTAAQPGQQTASAEPMETWRSDPFLPVGYKPPKKGPKPKPPILDFPFITIADPITPYEEEVIPEPMQPVRRMSGILINDRVFAIIESEGRSQVVQPGDILLDRLARVERIEPDKVILKTISENPRAKARYIVVTMAASQEAGSAGASTVPGMPVPSPGVGGMGPPAPRPGGGM